MQGGCGLTRPGSEIRLETPAEPAVVIPIRSESSDHPVEVGFAQQPFEPATIERARVSRDEFRRCVQIKGGHVFIRSAKGEPLPARADADDEWTWGVVFPQPVPSAAAAMSRRNPRMLVCIPRPNT